MPRLAFNVGNSTLSRVMVIGTCVGAAWVGTLIAEGHWAIPMLLVGSALIVPLLVTQPVRRLFLCWLAFGPVFARWGGIELGGGIPNITLDRLMVGMFAVKMTGQLLRESRGNAPVPLQIGLMDWALGGWIAVYLASTLLRGANLATGLFGVLQTAIFPAIVYYVTPLAIRTREDIRHLIDVLACVAVYLAVGAGIEQVQGIPLASGGAGLIRAGIFRSGSFVGAPWTLSYVLLLILPLLVFAEEAEVKGRRWLYRLAVASVFIAVFLSFNRSGWIALALELVVVLVFIPRWRGFVIVSTLVLAVVLTAVWPSLSVSDAYLLQLGDPTNYLGRLELAQVQWSFFLNQPWVGYGAGQGRLLGAEADASQNTWLTMLLEIGLIGTVSLLLFVGSAVWHRVGPLRTLGLSATSRKWSILLLASIAPMLMLSSSVDLTYFTFELCVTFAYLALFVHSGA
jgi:hypothetical protein